MRFPSLSRAFYLADDLTEASHILETVEELDDLRGHLREHFHLFRNLGDQFGDVGQHHHLRHVVDIVDHVVDPLRQPLDVLRIERGDERGVEPGENARRVLVTGPLDLLDGNVELCRMGCVGEDIVELVYTGGDVLRCQGEIVEEFPTGGDDPEFHRRRDGSYRPAPTTKLPGHRLSKSVSPVRL